MEDNLSLYRKLEALPGTFLSALDLSSPIVEGKGIVKSLPLPMKLHESEFYLFHVDDGIEERTCLIREQFLKEGSLTISPGDILSFESFHSNVEGELFLFLFDFTKAEPVLN
ncbi:hypothetical protein ACQR3P_28885 [Rhodococcus sp. IEGM1300]